MIRREVLAATAAFAATTMFMSAPSLAQAEAYRIAVLGGLSAQGILADNSSTSVLAAQASVEVINKAGGIGGMPVELVVIDDQADPTVAVTKVRELLASDTPPNAVLNSGPSTIAQATIPILNQAGVLSFNIGPTATSGNPAISPLNFDLSPSPADYAASFTAYVQQKGYGSVGIIHGNSSYGENLSAEIERQLTGAGIKVTANEGYEYSSLDMTPQIEKVRSTSPDAVILDGYGAVVGYVLQGIDKVGWDIPILGNISTAATGLISKEAPDGVLGTPLVEDMVIQVFASTKYDAGATEVNKAVETMLSIGEIKSSLILAYNYDAVALLAAAAAAAGSTDAKAMAAALETDAVTAAADTVILKQYGFNSESHAANVSPDSFSFIAPAAIQNGQYQ